MQLLFYEYNFSVKKSARYKYNRQNVSKKRCSLKMLVQHLLAMGHPGEVTSICLVNL